MNRNLAQFIVSRIVRDYLQLREKNLAPRIDQYASLWPEDPAELLSSLIFEEFRYRWRLGAALRTEVFLLDYPGVSNDSSLILRLLGHELQSVPEEPDFENLRTRFPELEEEAIRRLFEESVRQRLWNHDTISNTVRHTPLNGNTDAPQQSAEENWGETKAPSLCLDSELLASMMADHGPASNDSLEVGDSGRFTEPDDPEPDNPEPETRLNVLEEFEVRGTVQIEKHIGSGAWKDVYKAKQKSTLQHVAFKHLRKKNDTELEALIREVRTQAQLTHQNIPPVFEFDILDNGQAIVVEKLVNGSRWSDSMSRRTLDDNLRILLQVGQAVAYAHRRHQLIHRDLKPDNVVINDEFDEVYVIDWGLAVSIAPEPPDDSSAHISRMRGIAGTALYWAPEMALGETSKISTASDVFLLGGILYEILTRHPPYELFSEHTKEIVKTTVRFTEVGPMLRALRGAVFPPKIRAPERFIPDELALVAMKAMAPEPEDRYRDAAEFVEAVKRYQHHAEATLRGEAAWKSLDAVTEEIHRADKSGLYPLTLRLIELADTFHQVGDVLTEDGERSASPNGEEVDDPLGPALSSARSGELEARTKLFDLTLRTGDLTLAEAQIDSMQRNPLCSENTLQDNRRRLDRLLAVRRRARAMKWIAVVLLVAFFGSSMLYGILIDRQYRATERQRRIAEEQRRLAEENLEKARSAVNRFYTMFAKDDAVRNRGLMQLQRDLFDEAKKYHEDFVAQKSDDPGVLFDQMHALFDIARIETEFGNLFAAVEYYRRAVNEGKRLLEKQPDNPKFLDLLAKCYKDIGIVYERLEFDPDKIQDINLRALAINRILADRFSENSEYQRNLARVLHNLGMLLTPVPDSQDRAERYYRESLAVWERLRETDPQTFLFGKARTQLALGTLSMEKAVTALNRIERHRNENADGKPPDSGNEKAQEKLLEEIDVQEKLVATASRELELARELIETLKETYPSDYGIDGEFLHGLVCLEQGKACYAGHLILESQKNLGDAVEILRELVRKAPQHLLYLDRLDEACTLLYEILFEEGRSREQLELSLWRKEEVEKLMDRYPENLYHRYFWGNWCGKQAESLVLDGKIAEGAALLEKTIRRLETIHAETPTEETRQLLDLLKKQLHILTPVQTTD